MGSGGTVWKFIIGIVIASIGFRWHFYDKILLLGISNEHVGVPLPCKIYHDEVLEACEDIHFFKEKIIAACGSIPSRRNGWFPPLDNRGKISSNRDKFFLWNLVSNEVQEIRSDRTGNFVVHGFDILQTSNGIFIFAINHLATGSVVDVYKFSESFLSVNYQHSLSNPTMSTPNSIHAISLDEFYVTNDHAYLEGPLRLYSVIAQQQWMWLSHFKAGEWTKELVASSSLNGIAGISPLLFVNRMSEGYLDVHSRDDDDDVLRLRHRQSVFIGKFIDNVRVVGDNLCIAFFPNIVSTFLYLKAAVFGDISGVARIHIDHFRNGSQPQDIRVDKFFLQFKAATTALVVGDEVIVSGVLTKGLGRCKVR